MYRMISQHSAQGNRRQVDLYRRSKHKGKVAVVTQLTPREAYALAKRGACQQVRLRSALELLEGTRGGGARPQARAKRSRTS